MVFTKNLCSLALAVCALLTGAAGADARVISNTAMINWTGSTGPQSTPSNQVDIPVYVRPPVAPTIATYRFDSTSGALSTTIAPTVCAAANGSKIIELDGAFSAIPTTPASLRPEQSFHAGEPVAIGVTADVANLNASVRDTLEVTITLANGDHEQITLTEDAPNSARFFGIINTIGIPPSVVAGDCRLSVHPGEPEPFEVRALGNLALVASAQIDFLIDPFGIVFDSGDGVPVPGVTVTLINAATGQPAVVYGDDGVSIFPSTMVTGTRVTDSSGQVYDFPAGDYRFPFVAPGTYRLVVTPPSPYTAPSTATPAELAGFRRPDDGQPYTINGSSYGQTFTLDMPAPVRIDIPVDQPGTAVVLRKTTSTQVAAPGDIVQYRIEVANNDPRRTTGAITVRDTLPAEMRLRPGTVRYNGVLVDATIAANGRDMTVVLPPLAPATTGLLTYLGEVRVDAQPGEALNRASAVDARGATSNITDATVRIRRDILGDRMTIIGQITEGGCTVDPRGAKGVAGVRVMLQDGSYTVTDRDGRYHFEGVRPGIHVVQMDASTLPLDRAPADCTNNTRNAGSPISRFVEGRGGALKRADFRVRESAPREPLIKARAERAAPVDDPTAAGANRDWFAGQTAGIGWIFPEADYNPRVKAVRVAIKHLPGQKVELMRDGKAVDPLTFEGARKSPDESFMGSLWRAVEIEDRSNQFTARVLDANGKLVEQLERVVHHAVSPMRAELVREESVLIADGITRPVIAVRLTDRDGKPIKNGLTGDFLVPAPYYAAVEAEAQQVRQIAGLERARPVWRVAGDTGMAYIELEPTTASGTLNLAFEFRDGETKRKQSVEMWLEPGNNPWTVVGFAAGTVGYNTLNDRMEDNAESIDDLNADARLALYAKGRVQGKWLMTLAYDSDKDKDDRQFGGTIDPRAYYTIYADRSETRYDAASVRKLYLRLERPQFYALFGDYETGINDPQLARYQRSLNGVKAEYRGKNIAANAFAADTPYRYRRDEIQGNGLTGPYQLGTRDLLANSERITLEVRDRLRSDQIVESQVLTRHIDYDIDYLAGTLRFREPVLSRDSSLNPQFIVAEYEVDGVGQRVTNAGGRASYQTDDEKLRVGATFIHDETDTAKTNLGGVDVRYRPTVDTEVRAEVAISDASPKSGAAAGTGGSSTAWLVEAEHHGPQYDLLAYIREQEAGFGVGQLNRGENGTRKFGADGRLRVTDKLTLSGSAWQEDYLDSAARRRAGKLLAEYRGDNTDVRAGITHASDALDDGTTNTSSIVQFGVTQRLFDKRLELDAQTEFALGGQDESVDFPARHRFGARFRATKDISLIGTYEIAKGEEIDARTARVGFDVKPWSGGKVLATMNQQTIAEYGPRSFAAYGLSQSIRLNDKLTVDVTVDGNRTLGGIRAGDVLNPDQPVASGGFLAGDSSLTEDFIAVTTGASYRGTDWTVTTRAEYRNGEIANRYGFTAGVIRQLGNGRALGGLLSWTEANGAGAIPSTKVGSLEISWAHRPPMSRWSWLNKAEARYDSVRGAVAGRPGPIGGALLTVDGNVTSRRLINSLSINYSPLDRNDGGQWFERGEYSLFWGTRYATDRFGADDVKGWSNVIGGDFKFDLSAMADIGASGTVRIGTGAKTLSYAGGPTLTLAPFDNANITLGYNFAGFHDRDFEEARYSRSGAYVTFKLKFDQTSLGSLLN